MMRAAGSARVSLEASEEMLESCFERIGSRNRRIGNQYSPAGAMDLLPMVFYSSVTFLEKLD